MKLSTLIISLAIGLPTSLTLASPVKWDMASGGNGNLYELILQPGLTWGQANSAASGMGDGWHLATVTSENENQFIQSLLNPGAPYFEASCLSSNLVGEVCEGIWLGGFSSSSSANDWQWVTGEDFSFADWGPFEPFGNGDRLEIAEFRSRNQLMAWNDVPGGRTRSTGYIVEYERAISVPEPSAIFLVAIGLFGLGLLARNNKKYR
ncbi:MAG TPA: PEP-CTERM sorting domain-containing protein [Gammaproteobacteria bacterium]|nr:PEP-CTERM sorting domain-containing protein [Gammaproteobacteria bacterium]